MISQLRFILMLFLLCCLFTEAIAQNYDSLYREIRTGPDDTIKIRKLNELGYLIRKTNASLAIEIANESGKVAGSIGDTSGIIRSQKILGTAYTYGGEQAKAMKHLLFGLDLTREIGDKNKEASFLNNIGNLHFLTANYDEALSYYSQALEIRRENKDFRGMARTLGNMGNIANVKLHDLDLAIKYYNESLQMGKKLNDPELISTTLNNLGNIYRSRGNYEKALSYQKEAMNIELGNKDFFGLTYTYSSIVLLYIDYNQTDSALAYARKLEYLADSLNSLSRKQTAYYRMSQVYEMKNNFKAALDYHKAYQQVRDSLRNTRTARQIAEVEASYKNELQAKEVTELRNTNLFNEQKIKNQFYERLIWVLLTIILLGGLRLLWLQLKKNRNKTKVLVSQKEALDRKSRETARFNEIINKRNQELNETLRELKQTQEKLLETEKIASIGILTSGLAHELNNPLNYVSGVLGPIKLNLDELNESYKSGDQTHYNMLMNETTELMDSLSEGINKITLIINNLLEISPKIYPDQERAIELNKIIESAICGIQYNFPTVSFRMEAEEEVIIFGDYAELNQVFINLFKNAIDAMDQTDTPEIQIRIYREKQLAKVCISDNGCGMDRKTLKDIFQPFYTTKAPGKGAGLGLYVSYGILKKYEGTIEVESEKGVGTRFTVVLPVSEEETILR